MTRSFLVVLVLLGVLGACGGSADDGGSNGGGSNNDNGGGGGGGTPGDGGANNPGNPFKEAQYYVNSDWAAKVLDAATRSSSLAAKMRVVAKQPSAFWLDRIGAIAGTSTSLGLTGHLDKALEQKEASGSSLPMLVGMVVYDLPGRDCAAKASNGELPATDAGMQRYKTEYIDPIVRILKTEKYKELRIVAIVEPDSIPNLATNMSMQTCSTAAPYYKQGVAYAIQQLATVSNVSIYLDIAHSGWLGWEHTDKTPSLYGEVLNAAGGARLIRGFATNVANYSALKEPFDPYADVNANQTLIQNFYEWNRMIDETAFVSKLRSLFPDKYFLIDTGRNGWKAQANAQTPIEARTHRGNWCNITGAGIGERLTIDPMAGVDAYYWMKPPGESDGTSDASQAGKVDSEGKTYDPMCGPSPVSRQYTSKLIPTDALQGAPAAGHWFESQFQMLVQNATPPL